MKRDSFVTITVRCKHCGNHISKRRLPERIASTMDKTGVCQRCKDQGKKP